MTWHHDAGGKAKGSHGNDQKVCRAFWVPAGENRVSGTGWTSKGGIRDVLQDRKDIQRNGKYYRNLDDGWCVLSEKSGAVLLICSTWNHNAYYRSIRTGIFPDTGMAVPEKKNKGGEGACQKRSSVRASEWERSTR